MTVVICCGETRQSLSAVRSLGRAGIPVAVSAVKRPTLSTWSRYATSNFLTADAALAPHDFAKHISEELRGRYATCALVGSDDALWALSRFRELLPPSARRLLPPHISVVRALDHEALHHFAKSVGVPCGNFLRISENASFDTIISQLDNLAYPMLLRPTIPWIEREDGSRGINRRFVVKSKRHLQEILKKKPELFTKGILVSAYESKRALSYFGVCDKGQVLVEGTQERLNEQEPYNEVATLALTIDPIPSIRKYAQELLSALQWQGPFKVEFIKDQRGYYRLISVIGRMWGSVQLAISAGCNIPLICYRLAEGSITPDLLQNAQPNVRMRWLLGDAQAKIFNVSQLFSQCYKWARLPTSWMRKGRVKTCFDVLDFEDPMPFLFELQHQTWRRAFSERH
jgi:predicted ATP-grasp superfamily ATP-dependent carboligase